jgi:serine/threonine protein kinase
MSLAKKGTLHRDVSTLNILFGQPGAELGNRGVLIDFDMATHFRTDGVHSGADWKLVSSLLPVIRSFAHACNTPGHSLLPVGSGAFQQ